MQDVGLKLHSLIYFDAALKIGWLTRYLRSTSKWTRFPDAFEFVDIYRFGKNVLNRLLILWNWTISKSL